MSDAYEVAQRIAGNRKAYRRLSEAWCPTCSKLVAAVVVLDGESWLWLVGGRSGSHAEMLAEFTRNLRDAEHDVRRARDLGLPDAESNAQAAMDEFTRLLAEIREGRYPAWTPGMAWSVAYALRLGHWQDAAACRGCRRDVWVTLDDNLNFSVSEAVPS